ncbi:hypothetical protein JW921_08160, partial [Candidatus Fermentibacterales bacterium]|nr:hypothetical protein [Candidatus Fermentibacterales bacterium]
MRAAAPICLFLAGLAILIAVHPYGVPPMDDTYIHLTYGRSIVQGEFMRYSHGAAPSSGTTSPLWTLLASVAATSGSAAPRVIMLMGAGAAALALLVASRRRWTVPLLLTGPFLFHSSSGMETGLAVLIVVVTHNYFDKLYDSTSGTAGAGIVLGVAILVRPEMAVLALPLALAARAGRRGGASLAPLLLPAIVAGSLWASWNLYSTGRPLPAPFYAKAALALAGSGGSVDIVGLLKGLALSSPLMLALLPLSALHRERRLRPHILATGLLLLAALLTQPNAYFQMRYYVPFLASAAISLAVWTGIVPASAGASGSRGLRAAIPAVCALLALPGIALFAQRR